MSAETTVRVSQDQNGRFTATDTETGESADGETQAEALARLARQMATASSTDAETRALTNSITSLEDAVAVIDELTADAEDAGEPADSSPAAEFVSRSRTVQRRFEDEEVSQETVSEAIEWARSE